eukprot:GAHX01000137.1.p1 GENE.GAHX01000137.1~~GAHX01000137.1.p1  ORF type:complete len:671 (+),score=134.59 GAHX01000137.1:45-2057(+)
MEKISILNSLTKKVEELIVQNNHLNIYVCGPTTYAPPHLGHGRTYLTVDIIRRILEGYFNISTTVAMNITDVDDKIIASTTESFLFDIFSLQIKESKNLDILKQVGNFYSLRITSLKEQISETELLIEGKDKSRHIKELEEDLLTLKYKLKNTESDFNRHSQTTILTENIESVLSENKAIIGSFLREFKQGKASGVMEHSDFFKDIVKNSPVLDDFTKFARFYEMDFFENLSRLSVLKPDVLTRCTEFIPQMIEFTQQLLDSGLAYKADDKSIYFDLKKYRETPFKYGTLINIPESNELKDFALWKHEESIQPFWEAPFGRGRPGWHLECSVMSTSIFGPFLDIHLGGCDLKFPHHENEIAQCNAYNYPRFKNGKVWCTAFMHTGHLNIRGHKMSKSLKNFITIEELINSIDAKDKANVIRILFINSGEYYNPMNFEDEQVQAAKEVYRYLKEFLGKVKGIELKKEHLNNKIKGLQTLSYLEERYSNREQKLLGFLNSSKRKVDKHLRNNFSIKSALNEVLKLVDAANKYINICKLDKVNSYLLMSVFRFVDRILSVFGIAIEIDTLKIKDLFDVFESRELIRQHFKSIIEKDTFIEAIYSNIDSLTTDNSILKEQLVSLKKLVGQYEKGEIEIIDILKKSDSMRDTSLENLDVIVEDFGMHTLVLPSRN